MLHIFYQSIISRPPSSHAWPRVQQPYHCCAGYGRIHPWNEIRKICGLSDGAMQVAKLLYSLVCAKSVNIRRTLTNEHKIGSLLFGPPRICAEVNLAC